MTGNTLFSCFKATAEKILFMWESHLCVSLFSSKPPSSTLYKINKTKNPDLWTATFCKTKWEYTVCFTEEMKLLCSGHMLCLIGHSWLVVLIIRSADDFETLLLFASDSLVKLQTIKSKIVIHQNRQSVCCSMKKQQNTPHINKKSFI